MKLFKQKSLSEDDLKLQQWVDKYFIAVEVQGLQIPYWICRSCYCNISDGFVTEHVKACHVLIYEEIKPILGKTKLQESKGE